MNDTTGGLATRRCATGISLVLCLTLSLVAVACAHGGRPPPPRRFMDSVGARAAQAEAARLGLLGPDVEECPDRACLERAARSCTRAHLLERFWGIEGPPIFQDWYLGRPGAPCGLVLLSDHSQNYWGACRVWVETCDSLLGHSEAKCQERVLMEVSPCEEPTYEDSLRWMTGKAGAR